MNYGILFTRSWKYLWKSWQLWLFCVMCVLPTWLLQYIRYNEGFRSTELYTCLIVPILLLELIIFTIGWAGLIRSVYIVSKDGDPSLTNTWVPIRSNLGRMIVAGFIVVLLSLFIALILFFATGAIVRIATSHPLQHIPGMYLFYVFSGYIYECLAAIFFCTLLIENQGFWESIRFSLGIVMKSSNLKRLITINLLLFVLMTLPLRIVSIGILWVQADFSLGFIQSLNFETYLAITRYTAYIITSRAVSFVFAYMYISVLTLAYLEFRKEIDPIKPQYSLP